jgi:hypothetical protein
MSKKLYSTNKWKDRSRKRQEDELGKLRERRDAKRAIRRARIRTRTRETLPYKDMVAPGVFSLLHNAEEVINFLRDVKSSSGQNHLSFDFSGITSMTSDAVAAFVATTRVLHDTKLRGNLPKDPVAREMLIQSGFFDHVKSREPLPSVTRGHISQWQSKRVEPKFAQDLIHAGTKAIFGEFRHQQATYRVLIESMTNTRNHASEAIDIQQTWWATVYADVSSNCVCYTILDMGVGIFRSLKVRGLRKLYRALGVINNAEILREILEGRIESSTGVSYRGKGLPAIYRAAQNNRIRSLVIVTNDVYANVGKGEFKLLPVPFNGTLLYWEN